MNWIIPYLNRPWVNGEADCWELFRDIYKAQLAIELPKIVVNAKNLVEVIKAMETHPHLADWHPVDKPQHMCLTFWSQHKRRSHVGMYIDVDGGRILHTTQRTGSVCQPINDLILQGWQRPEFHVYKDLL